MNQQYAFQYCQKIVIFSEDESSVLLCKRQGEADYDGTYTFIGGKMEVSDDSIVAGLAREKTEEIGKAARVRVAVTYTHNVSYVKKDGSHMVLPHYYAIYGGGEIQLSDEYSEFVWVPIKELATFEPKVENIPEMVAVMQRLKSVLDPDDFVEM